MATIGIDLQAELGAFTTQGLVAMKSLSELREMLAKEQALEQTLEITIASYKKDSEAAPQIEGDITEASSVGSIEMEKIRLASQITSLRNKNIRLKSELKGLMSAAKASRSYIIDFMTGEIKNVASRPYSGTAAHDWFDEHIDMIPKDDRELFREDYLGSQSAMDILILLDEGYTPEEVVKKVKGRIVKLKEEEDKKREQEQRLAEKKKQEKEQMREPAGVVFSSNAEAVPIGF